MKPSSHPKGLHLQEVRKVRNHKCSLPEKCDLLMSHYIYEGYFVGLRRRFRYLLLSSPDIPESKIYLKSTAEIDSDHHRHLKYHYHIIHPFSEGRFIWEFVMTLVFTVLLLILPLEVMQMTISDEMLVAQFVVDFFCYCDIIMNFFTGYLDPNCGKVVLNQKKIVKRYVFSYFLFDLISSMPIKGIIRWAALYDRRRHIKTLLLFKIIRLPTLSRYFKRICRRMKVPDYMITFIIYITCFVVLLIWTTCLCLVAKSLSFGWNLSSFINESLTVTIIKFLYESISIILLVGPHKSTFVYPVQDIVYITCIILLLVGSMVSMVILAQATRIYTMYTTANNKYSSLLKEIKEYSRFKGLSPQLEEKILDYVDFKYQKNIVDETTLLKNLSAILKEDLLFHNCQRLIEKVPLFKDMPGHVITRLVTKFKPEIFMPGDTIVQVNTIGNCMFFIYSGTVAVYTEYGKEITHLIDGDNFGEIALLLNAPRVASVIAVTECELFKLYRKDFQDVLDPYPKLRRKINVIANERFQDTTRLVNAD